jgi:5-methyltetrahydropteroyltriglutamate--homocysteine methyltransferase
MGWDSLFGSTACRISGQICEKPNKPYGSDCVPNNSVLLPTTLVGSYPQPEWLIDRPELVKSVVRTRTDYLWRIPKELRAQAFDDATLLAVRDQERAGLDIISDGEQSRESYSNHFAESLEGVDVD